MLLTGGSILNLMATLDFVSHCISFFIWAVRKLRGEFAGAHLLQQDLMGGGAFHKLTAALSSS